MNLKNEIKRLMYTQENKPCNSQTIQGLFRSVVEPILDKNVESLVLVRLEDDSKNIHNSILKRLEFSNATVYDFSDTPINENKFKNILKNKIWDKTEFIYVLAERFSAVLIFDYEECELKGYAQSYMLHNSLYLNDTLKLINENSKEDLSKFIEYWHPERRNNSILNSSIRKIINNLNETNQEMIISQLEQEKKVEVDDASARLNFLLAKSSYISHEMRNLFSICNLYSTIIEKQISKLNIKDEEIKTSMLNASECIKKSLTMSGNLLYDFKSLRGLDLKTYNLFEIVETAIELAKVYTSGKNIEIKNEVSDKNVEIFVDEYKFLSVVINLIKNAVEALDDKNEKMGHIIVSSDITEKDVKINVSNDGAPIAKEIQAKIFEEGFTTKSQGSGLGLVICSKTMEEQFGKLALVKSDDKSTDFQITVVRTES